jgi:hypothetical protein
VLLEYPKQWIRASHDTSGGVRPAAENGLVVDTTCTRSIDEYKAASCKAPTKKTAKGCEMSRNRQLLRISRFGDEKDSDLEPQRSNKLDLTPEPGLGIRPGNAAHHVAPDSNLSAQLRPACRQYGNRYAYN